MTTIYKIEDLDAWQEARRLCKMIYIVVNKLPKSEDYNLKKHLRESSRGTAANIAEGFGRYFFRDSLRFYGIAKGCLNEVKSDLHVSFDVGYIKEKDLQDCIEQANKVEIKINGLIGNTASRMNNSKNQSNSSNVSNK